jgi:hypothetical protein
VLKLQSVIAGVELVGEYERNGTASESGKKHEQLKTLLQEPASQK